MTSIFSSETIQMLEENGYPLNISGPIVTFRYTTLTKVFVLALGLILTLITIFFTIQNPVVSVICTAVILLFTRLIWISLGKTVHFQVDKREGSFKFYDTRNKVHYHFLSDIDEVSLKSTFKSEYSSAFKDTSEEHEITFRIRLSNNKILTVFTFKSDYSEPGEKILEIFAWFEKLVMESKNKNY